MEMNFCRRCGAKLQKQADFVYQCERNHTIFLNAAPAAGVILQNEAGEVLMAVRAIEPGAGLWDMPGGFCDGAEAYEDAVARELEEELGLSPADYSTPRYLVSHPDSYPFKGETLIAETAVFWARLNEGVRLSPRDDVASTEWVAAGDIDPDRIFASSHKKGLEIMKAEGLLD